MLACGNPPFARPGSLSGKGKTLSAEGQITFLHSPGRDSNINRQKKGGIELGRGACPESFRDGRGSRRRQGCISGSRETVVPGACAAAHFLPAGWAWKPARGKEGGLDREASRQSHALELRGRRPRLFHLPPASLQTEALVLSSPALCPLLTAS